MSNVIPRRPEMTFEQRGRAIGMLTTGMMARDYWANTPDIEEQVQFQNPMGLFNLALNILNQYSNTKYRLGNFFCLNLSLSIPNFISNEARYHILFLV